MFGISLGTALSVGTGLASAGAGIAGASGGGGELSKEQKLSNMYQLARQMELNYGQNTWLNKANKVAKKPANWAAYSGQRVADLTPDQLAAFEQVRNTAGGDQFLSGAGDQAMKTLNGDYLNYQSPTNQYMGQGPSTANSYIGQQPNTDNQYIGGFGNYSNPYEGMDPSTQNGYLGATTNVVNNPMLGMDNPYLTNAINNAANDTIRNYKKAVAPSTDAAFARSGAFGGSAWGEQTAENERNLANTLDQQATSARMNDYQTQQGLMNQNANFQTSVNQNDLSRNSGLAQSQLGMNQQNWLNNANMNQTAAGLNQNTWQSNLGALANQNALNSQNWQANLSGTQAQNSLANQQWQTNAQLAQNQIDNTQRNYMAERGYQQNNINNALNLHNQGYTDANNLLSIGNQGQQQNQNNINANMDYYTQNQQSKIAPINWMLGNYNTALGTALPPQLYNTAQSNPYAAGLGGAIGGYQLASQIFNSFNKPSTYSYDGTFSGLPMFA